MVVLNESSDPALYSATKDRNLELQYYLLETAVNVAVGLSNFKFTPRTLMAIHHAAANFLDHHPGNYRDDFVHIRNSPHKPPPPDRIRSYMDEYFSYLNENFQSKDRSHLAAFALWRLAWIHPFFECNGRTARAYCHYVLCVKNGYWTPGRRTIHAEIREKIDLYYKLLRECDIAYEETGRFQIDCLEEFVDRIFVNQLTSR